MPEYKASFSINGENDESTYTVPATTEVEAMQQIKEKLEKTFVNRKIRVYTARLVGKRDSSPTDTQEIKGV